MVTDEAFEAWLKEVRATWDRIYSEWGSGIPKNKDPAVDAFMLAVFEKAIRPYFFFSQEQTERALLEKSGERQRPAGQSPFGRESVAAQQSGGSATAKCASCGQPYEPRVKGASLCLKCWISRQREKEVRKR